MGVFHQKSSSIKGCLPSKVIFHHRQYSISSGCVRCALDCFNTNCFFPKRPKYKLCYLKRFDLPRKKLIFSDTFVTMITFSDCTVIPSLLFVCCIAPGSWLWIWVLTKVVISKHSPAMLVWVLLGPILASFTPHGMVDSSAIVDTIRSITVNISYTKFF